VRGERVPPSVGAMSTSRRQFLAATAALPLTSLPALAGGQEPDPAAATPRLQATVILVRHTEKAKNDPRDPDLSEAGRERAAAFAQMFAAAGVTALVHSEFKRTRDTLAPLAEQLDLTSETIPARDMDGLIARLQGAKAREVIVVAGHSNTIPAIAARLGVTLRDLTETSMNTRVAEGHLPHDAYDRVHVLTPGSGGARALELRYGAPTPAAKDGEEH
jgi:phosphohistidine phosphatase SixA